MRKVTLASVSLLVTLAGGACAQEPIFIPPEQTTAAGNQASSGAAGDGGGTSDGGSGPSGPSSSTGDGGSSGDGGSPGTGGAGGDETPPAAFSVAIDADAPSIELRDSATVTVTIDAEGDVGPVALAVEGLPDDVTATFSDEMPTIVAGSQTIDVELASASDTATGTFPFTIRAVAPSGDEEASGSLTVEPVLTVVIPMDLDTFDDDAVPDTTAFGDYPTRIRALPDMSGDNPITIHFFNADDVTHEIHAGNPDQGFGHGQGPIPPGEMDFVVREVNAPGTYDYYPHDIGQSILGRIIIE